MRRIPVSVRSTLSVFGCGVLFFTFFRCLLIAINWRMLMHTTHERGIMWHSMLMGLRFDTVVSGYILIVPAALLIIADLFNRLTRRWLLAAYIYIATLYILAMLMCAADIPFFANYNNRLNITILNWTSSPAFMIKMVWQDHAFMGYFVMFVVLSALFICLLRRIFRKHARMIDATPDKQGALLFRSVLSLLFLGLMFLGIRGRTSEKSPINVGTAYFCDFDFANQAGLNPVFTFIQSWMDSQKEENKELHLMNDQQALAMAQSNLHSDAGSQLPLMRYIKSDSPAHQYNVVVVIMESMCWSYMERFGNKQHLTPYLDSIANKGYSFDNFYSAGIHTFNGIFSVLYSYPALLARHTMYSTSIPSYTGLPWFLQQRGYQTIYFTTHDDQFDNVGGFLTANHFNRIVSQKDYPSSEVVSTLGVPDHTMFYHSLPELNSYANSNKPFLAVYMTATNHPPFTVPDNIPFKPVHNDVHGGCVEYADWAISSFMHRAASQPWFNNTIFVFTGDHGVLDDANYGDMALGLNRVPCIIYGPPLKGAAQKINAPGGQIDIFPTIAGLLGGAYTNNTMGVDLLHEGRPYIFFSQDDKIGVANDRDLYIWRKRGQESYYHLWGSPDLISAQRASADTMQAFAFSMLQSAQWLLLNKKTGSH